MGHGEQPPNNDDDDDDGNNSSDEALCELLGIESMNAFGCEEEEKEDGDNAATVDQLFAKKFHTEDALIEEEEDQTTTTRTRTRTWMDLQELYEKDGYVVFPISLNIPDWFMRRITDELVWSGGDRIYCSDKTYERVQVVQRDTNHITEKRVLTRLENFVNSHEAWKNLCDYIGRILSQLCGEPMVLFKEKLNLKPPGGSGFAPHLDAPSLRVALGEEGPQTFLTVMVSIDPMTSKNGCLRLCPGPWGPQSGLNVIEPTHEGNPDSDGRAGALSLDAANLLEFQDVSCPKGGMITVFGGWMPHRSAANASPFSRRAVFLTYNPACEGDFHDAYYQEMGRKRQEWRQRFSLVTSEATTTLAISEDEQADLDALATIPRI